MAFPQPPDEGSDCSFWAAVYDEEPPNILCGVLTDLNLHRFTLHQHLTTNAALTETPLLHQTFEQALPPAIQRRIRNYNTNLNLANVHLRRALDALDSMGRHPPRNYLRNPDTGNDDPPAPTTTEPPFPTPSTLSPGQPVSLPPAIRHYLPTFQPGTLVFQHTSTQTTPTHFTAQATQQTDIIIGPPMIHEEQQTSPRPDLCHIDSEPQQTTSIQTDIHAIVRYPAFATPNAASIPTSSPSTASLFPTTPISTSQQAAQP